MNWQLITQLLSYAVAIISSVVSFTNNRKNNKTIKEIELTKQQFARENEELKRKQSLEDKKSNLISNFLGKINAYQGSHMPEAKEAALDAAGKVISVCTPKQKEMVNDVIDALNQMEYHAPQSVWDHTTKVIIDTTINFNTESSKSE